MTQSTNHSISHDFFSYGIEGVGVSRATEVRMNEQAHDRNLAALRAPERPSSVRRWLGNALISAGNGIAGRNVGVPNLDCLTAQLTVGSDLAR